MVVEGEHDAIFNKEIGILVQEEGDFALILYHTQTT